MTRHSSDPVAEAPSPDDCLSIIETGDRAVASGDSVGPSLSRKRGRVRAVLSVLMVGFIVVSTAVPTEAADRETVSFVQETLTELGYDPGPIDGAWGGRTRSALNAFRASKGLEEARELTGSSLYLLHREAPGEVTLPRPGEILEGFSERAAYLAANPDVRSRHCNNRLQLEPAQPDWTPVRSFTEGRITGGGGGYISDADDWFSPLSEGLVVSGAQCLQGLTTSCETVWTLAEAHARDNALQTSVARRRNSEAYDGVAWIGNTVLASLIVNSAIAADRLDLSIAVQAPVLDWLYDRVNAFNYISRARTDAQSRFNSVARNHAMAAVLPSMLLGAWIGDRELYDRGRPQYEAALANMRPDGSFPTETQRGSRALHYTGLMLSYLTAMAEVAKAQGDDLYGIESPSSLDLHDAVAFNTRGWQDWNGVVLPYAQANHAAPKTPTSPMAGAFELNHGWLPTYLRRFPDHPNVSAMKNATLDPVVCSPDHVADGRSHEWWCRSLSRPVSYAAMLRPGNQDIAVSSHLMGFNSGCMLATNDVVLEE